MGARAHNGRRTGADMAAGRRPITYEDREQIEAGLNRVTGSRR